jgi:hypothetical protein
VGDVGFDVGMGFAITHCTWRHAMKEDLQELLISLIWMVIAASIGMFIGIFLEIV